MHAYLHGSMLDIAEVDFESSRLWEQSYGRVDKCYCTGCEVTPCSTMQIVHIGSIFFRFHHIKSAHRANGNLSFVRLLMKNKWNLSVCKWTKRTKKWPVHLCQVDIHCHTVKIYYQFFSDLALYEWALPQLFCCCNYSIACSKPLPVLLSRTSTFVAVEKHLTDDQYWPHPIHNRKYRSFFFLSFVFCKKFWKH
jgi:hypothetical protein